MKYATFHKIAMTNWMATAHRGSLNLKFVELVYKNRQHIPVKLVEIIFSQIMSFTEPKVKLSYPSLIFGILTLQGFKPYESELLESPQVRTVDKRLFDPPHAVNVVPAIV